MKTIKYIGQVPTAFGVVGKFEPGQEATIDNDLADKLINKGFFEEVPQKKVKPVQDEISEQQIP